MVNYYWSFLHTAEYPAIPGIVLWTLSFERTNIDARIRKGHGPVAQSDPVMDPEEVEHRAFSSWE